MSNFNYRSLVWKLSSSQLLSEMESLQKRALRFLLDGYDSTYEDLLEKSGRPNMNLKRQITRCIEIYQTLIKLNPRCMILSLGIQADKRMEKNNLSLENIS